MAHLRQLHWWSDPRQWLRALLMLDDAPHYIALGTAVGVFVGLTPTVGLQMVLVLLIWTLVRPLFRFNRMAALIAVYVSNPLTVVPMYWFNYRVGTLYFSSTITRKEFAAIFQYDSLSEWWQALTRLFVDVGVPLVVGSLIVATVGGLITYPLMLRLFMRLRHQQPRERQRTAGGLDKETVKQQPVRI